MLKTNGFFDDVSVEVIDFVNFGFILDEMLDVVVAFILGLLFVVLIIGPLLIEDFNWASTFGAIIPLDVNICNMTITNKQ